MRFIGNIEAKVDVKGRAFLPAAFRKVLQESGEESLVLRKDIFEPCLVLYPESAWNRQLDMLRQKLNRWDGKKQAMFRQFVNDAELITLDSNGRLLIPKRHLKLAEIEQDVRFIGMDDTSKYGAPRTRNSHSSILKTSSNGSKRSWKTGKAIYNDKYFTLQ